MRIGIIGAGNIGSCLAQRFTGLGHEVTIANSRGPDTLTDVVATTGASAASVSDVVRDQDLVVVTIPMRSVPELPPGLFHDAPAGLVVVDTNNYVPQQRDGRIDQIEDGALESRWVAELLGHPVVKAFNNIAAACLVSKARPRGEPDRIALPVSGDDPEAKAVVIDLVDELGFEPVDVGTLDESWRHQPGSLVYGTDLPADELREALSRTPRSRSPKYTALV